MNTAYDRPAEGSNEAHIRRHEEQYGAPLGVLKNEPTEADLEAAYRKFRDAERAAMAPRPSQKRQRSTPPLPQQKKPR